MKIPIMRNKVLSLTEGQFEKYKTAFKYNFVDRLPDKHLCLIIIDGEIHLYHEFNIWEFSPISDGDLDYLAVLNVIDSKKAKDAYLKLRD